MEARRGPDNDSPGSIRKRQRTWGPGRTEICQEKFSGRQQVGLPQARLLRPFGVADPTGRVTVVIAVNS